MEANAPLIPPHGGYRKLKGFQVAQLVYDLTAAFCDRFVDRRSRTHDQMVQAARSGVQNIAEGSQASGTSKKMEMKLTNVARASLEELRLDYEDFLRQRGLPQWPPDNPALVRFKAKRCSTMDEVRSWVEEERQLREVSREKRDTDGARTDTEGTQTGTGWGSVSVGAGQCKSYTAVLVANAALSLLNLCCYFLDRQLAAQAAAFESEGGFTERLYRVRRQSRGGP